MGRWILRGALLALGLAVAGGQAARADDYPALTRLIEAARKGDIVAMAALFPPLAREMSFRGNRLTASRAADFYRRQMACLSGVATVARVRCTHEGQPLVAALVAAYCPRRDMPKLPRKVWNQMKKRGMLERRHGHEVVRHLIIMFRLAPPVRHVLRRGFEWTNPSLPDGLWLPYRFFFSYQGRQAWERLIKVNDCRPYVPQPPPAKAKVKAKVKAKPGAK